MWEVGCWKRKGKSRKKVGCGKLDAGSEKAKGKEGCKLEGKRRFEAGSRKMEEWGLSGLPGLLNVEMGWTDVIRCTLTPQQYGITATQIEMDCENWRNCIYCDYCQNCEDCRTDPQLSRDSRGNFQQ